MFKNICFFLGVVLTYFGSGGSGGQSLNPVLYITTSPDPAPRYNRPPRLPEGEGEESERESMLLDWSMEL